MSCEESTQETLGHPIDVSTGQGASWDGPMLAGVACVIGSCRNLVELITALVSETIS